MAISKIFLNQCDGFGLKNIFKKRTLLKFNKVVSLPYEMAGLQQNAVKLFGTHIYGKNTVNVFRRREAVVIKNLSNGQTCIRYAFGAGRLPGVTKSSIALDYDGISELGISGDEDVSLEMRSATTYDLCKWFWSYPEVGIRFSFKLATIGAALGVLQIFQQHYGF